MNSLTNQTKSFHISKCFNHRFSASLYTDESVDLQWSPQVTKYKKWMFFGWKDQNQKSIKKNTFLTRWQAVLDSLLLVSALCFFSYIQLDFVFLDDPTKSYVLFFFIILLNYPSVCRSLAFLFLPWLSGVTLIGDISYNLLVLVKMSCYT